ncbi:MAG TPA: FtsX-like permease family protein [Methylomirabilota bacterium]|nr:FtsX-like permease family protein [Methylomirabilota bacterium]
MTTAGFIFKNALRNKRRALLSILSVAVSLFLLVTLLVGVREMTVPPEDVGAAARIVVRNKISIATLLPPRQRPIIEAIPGIEAVTPFTWFGGSYKEEGAMAFGQFAIDPSKFPHLMGEAKLGPGELETFIKDRTTCIIGRASAEKYKLKVGDRLPLQGTMWPVDLDLRIAGIYSGSVDDRNVFFHHKYLDELLGSSVGVGTWWVKAKTLEDVPLVVERINKAFANSAAEVRAETERAFQLSFVSMWGNIKLLVQSICSAVVFTLALVTASTMSMAIRERFREMAVLKALGYRRRELFAFILAESFGLAAVGALIGVGGAYAIFTYGDVAAMTNNVFIMFEVTPRIIGISALVAAGLGIVSAIAPSIAVARMSVVKGLKTLD